MLTHTIAPAEARRLVAAAISRGLMSYPGGVKTLPEVKPMINHTEARAAAKGMTPDEYRAWRREVNAKANRQKKAALAQG